MVKIDLITGFLGSGKTTFIKKYAKYLLDKGMNIGILENDFGAVNVDMLLLQELMGDNCELEMISGGCDKETHRRRFRTKLIAMGMCGYDRVIVEPSGIYDVDEFFDVLHDEPLDRWYEIGNVITIVDVKLEEDLSEEADYLLASEAANAGSIILSRAEDASAEQIENTIQHLNKALEKVHCKRKLEKEIWRRDGKELSKADFDIILNSGYVAENYQKMDFDGEQNFESLYFMELKISETELKDRIEKMMQDPKCGEIFRVKGFAKRKNDSWVELNATGHEISMRPIENGQEVVIVIGENLKEDKIRDYLKKTKRMTKQQRTLEIIERLRKEYPDADCTLDYDQAWKLLVSVRLAAQCTDARVNVVVEGLFAKYPTVEALAEADVNDIEAIVRPCGLGKSKARDISACMKMLRDEYDGKIPKDFNAILKLPGVGRKSANLIMGDVFGEPAIVTDTHCIRLVNRMGIVDGIKDPKKVEMELWKLVPPEEGSDFCHRLVYHGREVCTARTKPHCERCCLADICKKVGVDK